ncbi:MULTISPECIES: hypothetical protein [Priestia]|uniref:Uncharacterized protein n=1 Tax=Priestia megaterium (strain DSM 319 / IMG 1521) TaxID=592022 RepID=D5DGM7_PRIM3|nr:MULTISPECIES: hypothetical protein [Priestia]ADF39749.1 hypothetical protein BMD_2908 [Priestia megaterium DSM 319]MDC0705187.1 hypothetical protein [Priestia sp. AB]MDM8150233.1 hypothetical protein [Priestia megaterium]MED3940876.1 hypothetical protein [Priestia megaterium]MED4210795.1 hypothetical protein [Priestia megaterium]
MTQLMINNVNFHVDMFEEKMITDANTGEELKRLNFSFSVVGKAAYDKYDAFFEDPYFEVTNMETKETLTLKNISHSTFYQSPEITDHTNIVFRVKLQQEPVKAKEQVKNEQPTESTVNEMLLSRIKFKALVEILEEKGLLTENELYTKIEEVAERDFDILRDELSHSKKEVKS